MTKGTIEIHGILLEKIVDIGNFVELTSTVANRIDIKNDDGYNVNGKSLMGIMSLDLSKPLTAVVYGDVSHVFLQNVNSYSKK